MDIRTAILRSELSTEKRYLNLASPLARLHQALRVAFYVRWVRWVVFSVVLALIGASAPATAQQSRSPIDEVRIGILAHDVPGLWSGWRIETPRPDLNGELIFSPSVQFLGGTVRPVLGGSWNNAGGTSKAYADARWESNSGLGAFFGLGIGPPFIMVTSIPFRLTTRPWAVACCSISRRKLAIGSKAVIRYRSTSSTIPTATPASPTKVWMIWASATASSSE